MKSLEIDDSHWHYLCDLCKKTADALRATLQQDDWEDIVTLEECLEQLLNANPSQEKKESKD